MDGVAIESLAARMDGMAIEHPDIVRSIIAAEWLSDAGAQAVLGRITLRPHQVDAVSRVRALLRDAGGALLCDEVGMGKTYVALAVARACARPLVVAPASLRDMWLDAAGRAGVSIAFVSLESLSRGRRQERDHDLVIADEAHHFRTPATARYRALAALAARTPVLLLSATPLHNSAGDLTALLSLFLGSAARALSGEDAARYVVRRNQDLLRNAFPAVHTPGHLPIPARGRTLSALLALPPPAPPRDGSVAAAIVLHTLVRLWASSDAALREGLRRRLAKTIAIRHALESGHYPTRSELGAWTCADASVQLGFAAILSPREYESCEELLDAVRRHESALAALLASLPVNSRADAARVDHLRSLRLAHAGSKIVAFSQFAATARMYYNALRREEGVALLAARGARIASGPVARRDVLERFAPMAANVSPAGRRENISLLIATDLLSEGVNLQDACVIVHLDLPWTSAKLEQRVGRVARPGAASTHVFVYALDPPALSRQLLRTEEIIRRKARLADARIGEARIPPLFARPDAARRSEVEDAEAIRLSLNSWREPGDSSRKGKAVLTAVAASRNGLLALITIRGDAILIAGRDDESLSTDPSTIRETVEMANGPPVRASEASVESSLRHVRAWMEKQIALDDAGKSGRQPTLLARPLNARLAQLLATCPRHERAHFAARIAVIRRRLESPLTLGIEQEIDALLRSEEAEDFLGCVEQIIGPSHATRRSGRTRIHAIMILTATGSRDVSGESKK